MNFIKFTFWRPGYLNLALRRDSMTAALFLSLDRMLMMGCPMWTRATVPWGLPKAPLIPVWSLKMVNNNSFKYKLNIKTRLSLFYLSAPAHDNILLMRTTWKG